MASIATSIVGASPMPQESTVIVREPAPKIDRNGGIALKAEANNAISSFDNDGNSHARLPSVIDQTTAMTSSNDRARKSPIALSDSDKASMDPSRLRKSSTSSDNGLYEPIGEPRSVCTLERVVQLLKDRAPPDTATAAAAGHDNVYTAIDDDVCSFYSFQSSQSSTTNPSGRGSRQPTVGGTLTSNIYDPVSLETGGERLSRPSSTSTHWNTLEAKRENAAAHRRIASPSNDDKTAAGSVVGQPFAANQGPPRRPTRPGMLPTKADHPSSLDAIVENQTVASSTRYHAPAAASSQVTSGNAGNLNHTAAASSSSQFQRNRASSKPFKEVARAKVMAAIHAPSTKRFTSLFSKFPRRSKSLDPNFTMRVSGGVDDARDPVTSAANARVRASDLGLDAFASRMKSRKPFVKQKSFDDQLLSSSSSSASKSTAREAKEKKLSLRLMELLRIDKWHRRKRPASHDRSARNVTVHTGSFLATSISTNPSPLNEVDGPERPPDKNPLVRDFGSQGRLVATGSGETLVAHLEREIKSKQIILPTTPIAFGSGVTTTVISSTTTTRTTTHTAVEVNGRDEDATRSKKPASKASAKSSTKSSTTSPPSTLQRGDGKKTTRAVVAPKERPKVPPPKTPTFSPSDSFELKPSDAINAAKESSSSNASSSPPLVPSQFGNATKPAVPKKPQFNLNAQPTPPPRKVNRGPRSTSTGSSITSASSNNSDAKNNLPPSTSDGNATESIDLVDAEDTPCEDYLEPIHGGSLYSISEPLFTPSQNNNNSFMNRNRSVDNHRQVTTPQSGAFINGNHAIVRKEIEVKAPKPFPRRKSQTKRQKDKKRSLSEEKERTGTLMDSKKTSSSVDFLRGNLFEDEDTVGIDRHAHECDGKESPSLNGNSFRSNEGSTPSTTPHPHHYVTLTPDRDESPYEESRTTAHRIMKDTLDLVLKKTTHFLRAKEDRSVADRTRAGDWDILSHVPFSFAGSSGHRYEIFAASLKADPAKAYCLMVLPKSISFDTGRLFDFSRCRHHEGPPSIHGDFFLPVVGYFVVDARSDGYEDQSEAFFHDYDGRKVLVCPVALENLQTLDSFLTEKTLQDLATEETAESSVDSTRASILLQLFHLAQSFAQHRHCLADTTSNLPRTPSTFSIANVDSILIYAPSLEDEWSCGWGRPSLLLNPCEFMRLDIEGVDDDDDEDEKASAALTRWTGLILGDVLNSSFASVEEFMRSSTRHRPPRLDLRLCDAIGRLRAEIADFGTFLARAKLLLELLTQTTQIRKLCAVRREAEEEAEDDDEKFRLWFIRLCGVEEARVTGDLIRLLFHLMDNDQILLGGRDLARWNFDSKMALASAARNAQWLTQIRNDNFSRVPSIFQIFKNLIR